MRKLRSIVTAEDKDVFRLALPALAALISEPLMLVTETVVVGRLGAIPLASLALGSSVILTAVGLCIFLAYGTTAMVGRRLGAGDPAAALSYGISGIWVALLVGVAGAVAGSLGSGFLIGLFSAPDPVAAGAEQYLRIAAAGLPASLIVLAATGILRGMRDLTTPLTVVVLANIANIGLSVLLVHGLGLGLAGAAISMAVVQWLSAIALLAVIVRRTIAAGASLRLRWHGVLEVVRVGSALIVRTVTLRLAFLLSVAVASSLGAIELAAHQVVMIVMTTIGFALDALAISAQALSSQDLGAGETVRARRIARRMQWWGLASGVLAGVVLVSTSGVLPALFTQDLRVAAALTPALVVLGVVQPISAIVFVLDGVLIGAGDGRYLAFAGFIALALYVPAAAAVWYFEAGLPMLWIAYCWFMALRAVTLILRERSGVWLKTGALPSRPAD